MPCITRMISTRVMLSTFFKGRGITFKDQLNSGNGACSYVFRRLFRYFLIFRLSRSAQIFNGRGLSGILFQRLIRIRFRATFRINRARFRRYHSRAANEGIISNRGRPFLSNVLCNIRYINGVFTIFCHQSFITRFIRGLYGDKATRLRHIRQRIGVVCMEVLFINRCQECSLTGITSFYANEGGRHAQDGRFIITVFLYRKREIFANQSVSTRYTDRIQDDLSHFMRTNVLTFIAT